MYISLQLPVSLGNIAIKHYNIYHNVLAVFKNSVFDKVLWRTKYLVQEGALWPNVNDSTWAMLAQSKGQYCQLVVALSC